MDDIDSFRKVTAVRPEEVAHLLTKRGYLDRPEDFIQTALEEILEVPFHKKDWGGEVNDLYTANVVYPGVRTPSAFLLKGNGLKRDVMEIRDCGKNGDQLVRLFDLPAQLFVVQFVGHISEAVIKDAEGKVERLRAQGKQAWCCIIDGQDTARLVHAYGMLPGHPVPLKPRRSGNRCEAGDQVGGPADRPDRAPRRRGAGRLRLH